MINLRHLRAVSTTAFIVFSAVIFSHDHARGAAQQYQYGTACSDCHKMPPVDAAYRNVSTGGFKGSHSTHNPPATPPQAVCEKCHSGSGSYSSPHFNDFVNMTTNINNSPHSSRATYNKPRFFNWTSNPVMQTCSNVNCHFESVTPAWGSTPFTSPGNCNGCHGAPPADGSHPAAAGSGKKHGDYYTTGASSCVKCHPDHTAEPAPFAHATSVGKRALLLQFTASPNSGGSYSKGVNLTYPGYLPSQFSGARDGSCSSLYCHSNGAGGAPTTTPQWGGTLAADCTGCHGGNATSGTVLGSGKHTAHMNNAAVIGTNYECARCHNATVSAGNDRAVTTLSNHVNGAKTVSFNNGGSFAAGACSSTQCHAAGKAAAPQPAAPTWSGGALDCKGCHGVGGSYGEPNYANGGAAVDLANSHNSKHVKSAASCAICHDATTANGTAIKSGAPHTNGAINVSFNAAYNLGSAAYNDTIGTKSCSGIYCHSSGTGGAPIQTPKWGDTMPADCTGCHGNDTGSSQAIASGKHRAHLNNYTTLGRNNNYGCVTCHASTVSNNRTIGTAANHVNLLKNYSGASAGRITVAATGKCSTNYCHSTGQKTNSFWNMTGANWYSSRTLACTGCHGNSPSPDFAPVAGAPNYANGGSGTATANSHNRHVAGAGFTDSTSCAKCHFRTVDAVVANKLRNYSTLHIDRTRNVNFSASASIAGVQGRYSSTTQQCMSTYCHGSNPSARWGSAGLACTACHSAEYNTFNASNAGAHKLHYQVTTAPAAGTYASMAPGQGSSASSTSYQFNCTSCHASPATHAGGEAIAGTAAGQVYFGYSSAGRKGTYTPGTTQGADNGFKWTNGTCSTTYCHSNGKGGNPANSSFTWSSPGGTLGCTGCHDTKQTGATPTNLSGKHDKHMNPTSNAIIGLGNGLNCINCHAKTASGNTTLSDKTKHVNKFVDFSSNRGGGSARYDSSSKLCSSIYCHSNGNPGALVYQNPAAWSSGTVYGCNGCHGTGGPATGVPGYANGGAGTATANSHAKHVTVFPITDTTGCSACHVKTASAAAANKFKDYSAVNYHVNGTPNVTMAPAYGGTYNAGTSTCSGVSCHSNGRGSYQAVQWGTLSNCGLCHPIASLSASHAKHVNTALLPTFYTMTANRSTAATYDFGCSSCHLLANPNHTKGTVVLDLRPAVAGVGTLRSKNSAAITASGVAGTANSGTTGDSVPGSVVKCLNIYCHSNGWATGMSYATTPNWHGGTFTGDRCANCHGNSPNTTIAGSTSHYNNRFLGYTSTPGGHQIGIHAMGIYSSPSGLAVAGTGGRSSHGNAALATTISCNICHYQTVTTARNDDNAVCKTCHYAGNSVGAVAGNPAAIADKSKHVNGEVNVAFKPVNMLSRAQVRQKYFVTHAYSSVWTRNAGYKVSGSHDSAKSAFNTATMWDGSTKTCSNIACHNGNSVRWTDNDGVTECISCHGSL